MGPARIAREQQKKEVLSTVVDLIAKRGFDAVSREMVSVACGLRYTTVRSFFPQNEEMLRSAFDFLLDTINHDFSKQRIVREEVAEDTITAFFTETMEVVSCDNYLTMLRILIREAEERPWVLEKYYSHIVRMFEDKLSSLMDLVSAWHGTQLSLKHGIGRLVLRRLEMALTVPRLLPSVGIGATQMGVRVDVAREEASALIEQSFA